MTATTPARVVVILGAGGALGAAISSRLAAEPDTEIVLSDVSGTSLQATIRRASPTASRPCSPT